MQQLCVIFTRPPGGERLFQLGLFDAETIRQGLQIGSQRDDLADVRSRLAQPSSRWPIPGAKELSTVEWQRAHVMPIDRRLSFLR